MKKYIYILSLLCFFSLINVKAVCSSDEKSRLRSLAEKVEFTYENVLENYKEDGTDFIIPTFNITAFNLNKELKVLVINDYYLNDYKEFSYTDNGSYTLKGFQNNEKVTITFKGYANNECSGETVLTKVVSLPYYNHLTTSDECKLYPEFKYCKKLYDDEIDSRNFLSELEKYKKELEKSDDKPIKISSNDNIKFIIVAVSIVVIILIVTLVVNKVYKERRKNRL